MDIAFNSGDFHFTVRAVAVFMDDGHVLLHRPGSENFWCLPGGRVRLGEKAADAVLREMGEELDEEIHVDGLQWVFESFLDSAKRRHHEVGFYFLTRFANRSRYDKGITFQGTDDGNIEVTYRWFPIDKIDEVPDLVPPALYGAFKSLPSTLRHVIDDRASPATVVEPR